MREVVVPTCSYRMGVKEMAIGLAAFHIDSAATRMTYQNLWLPQRFPLLMTYAASLVVAGILYLLGCIRQKAASGKRPRSRRSSHSADYSKLM